LRYIGREGGREVSIWDEGGFGEWAVFELFFVIGSQSEGLKKEGFVFRIVF
jgi:hypothetical protein